MSYEDARVSYLGVLEQICKKSRVLLDAQDSDADKGTTKTLEDEISNLESQEEDLLKQYKPYLSGMSRDQLIKIEKDRLQDFKPLMYTDEVLKDLPESVNIYASSGEPEPYTMDYEAAFREYDFKIDELIPRLYGFGSRNCELDLKSETLDAIKFDLKLMEDQKVWNEIIKLRVENYCKISLLHKELELIFEITEELRLKEEEIEKEKAEHTNSLPQYLRCQSNEQLCDNLKALAKAFKPKADNSIREWDIASSGKKVTSWLEATTEQHDEEWSAALSIHKKLDEGLKEFSVEAKISNRNLKFKIRVVSDIQQKINRRRGYWSEGTWIEP
ncbi:hypothetical protein [Nostoc sp.]|uniref:hypothetical protein n=1 Tax=Nostoc sp. TaxID=1180 RepID=UPI002FF84235